MATRNGDGTFTPSGWIPLVVPGSSFTTGNTVIDNFGIGIYITSTSAGTAAYVATVPEPGATLLAAVGLVALGFVGLGRHAPAAAKRPAS